MWQDFFYFSKAQRNGIFFLIVLILVVLGAWLWLPFLLSNEAASYDKDFEKNIAQFKVSLQEQEASKRFFGNRDTVYPQKNTVEITLFAFNPNELDSAGFTKLGIKHFVASNIIKYRNKGGKFRTADDFGKVYGISEEQFVRLKPYIAIPPEPVAEKDSLRKIETPVFVELNTADTTELKKIRGVGGYAKIIIAYRNRLGGYLSTNQLLEIQNMTQEAFERIEPFLLLDTTQIRKIDVNRAGIDKLKNHPYLNFYNARAIYEYRRNNGKIKSLKELQGLYELPDDVLEKIMPYLEVNSSEPRF